MIIARGRSAKGQYNNYLYVKTSMSLTYWLVIAALDLAGVVFSARMLRRCFQDKMTFLYKCRTLAICQCACQASFVVTDAVQSWIGFETQARESCDVFRVLSISTLFFQACNIMAMMLVYSDRGQDTSSKCKITVALSLGLMGSAMIWWYSCFSQEFLPQMTLVIMFVAAAAFVLLFAVDIRHRLVNTITTDLPQAPMKTRNSLAWNVCKENKRATAFIILLVACLVVVLSDVPRSMLHFNASVYLIIMIVQRVGVGIGVPLTITDLIDSGSEQETEQEKFVVL